MTKDLSRETLRIKARWAAKIEAKILQYGGGKPGKNEVAKRAKITVKTVENWIGVLPRSGERKGSGGRRKSDGARIGTVPPLAKMAYACKRLDLSLHFILYGTGEATPVAGALREHVEGVLSDDVAWRAFVRRWDTALDGEKLLKFVVEEVRNLVTALSETDTALQHLETLGNMTHKEPHGFHAFRRLYAYVDHSASPALQQKAAALMTDWSPSLTGFGVSGDALRIDRFGAKRRKPGA